MSNTRQINVKIGNESYSITSDDNYLDYIKKGFEPDMVRLYKCLADGSNTILDIGANIGCTSLLFSDMAKTVHAFEPAESTFEFLIKNISESGKNTIIPHKIGLGSSDYQTGLAMTCGNRSGAFIPDESMPSGGYIKEKVQIMPLDKIAMDLGIENVDFIKIDVEGFESHVLLGAIDTLTIEKPVVVIEVNHWCLNAFQRTSIPDFFDLIRTIFPVALAVEGDHALDLHDPGESYIVMYQHIINMKFQNIVAAFDIEKLSDFNSQYSRNFPG